VNVQQRLETSRAGRVLLSAGIAALLACMVVQNLPASSLRNAADPATSRALAAVGADQQWNMFAPDPRSVSIALEARVDFRGGGATTWRPPKGGALIGQYWDYHWQKYVEHATFDTGPDADRLRDGLARFAARQVAAGGREPAAVTLVSVQRDGEKRTTHRLYRIEFGALGL